MGRSREDDPSHPCQGERFAVTWYVGFSEDEEAPGGSCVSINPDVSTSAVHRWTRYLVSVAWTQTERETHLVAIAGVIWGLDLSLLLPLWSFAASLCQLQRCPTFRCLPSLHLTACLKKINISAGKETKASIWCVYLRSSDGREQGANKRWRTLALGFTRSPFFWKFYLTKSLLRRGERKKERFVKRFEMRGQVSGDDTAEQSFNFSNRLVPLNLQVPVSFCRQCLNIVAVLIQRPWPFLRHARFLFLEEDKWRRERQFNLSFRWE